MIKPLGQRNYPGVMLGKTNYSLARYGCTTTDITIYYNWIFNKNVDPSWMAKQLEYTQDGKIIWSSLKNVGLRLVMRVKEKDDLVISKAIKDKTAGCLIEVENNHWLFTIGKNIFGGYRVCDPWFGDISSTNRYKFISGEAVINKL